MRFRRRLIDGQSVAEMKVDKGWRRLSDVPEVAAIVPKHKDGRAPDLLPYLQIGTDGWDKLLELGPDLPEADTDNAPALLPVEPRSFRDFMLFETHVVAASRGMVRRFLPEIYRITCIYELLTGKTFPKFKPHKLWYKQPIYYLSNHLNMVTDGDTVIWPRYSDVLDYELEIGAILAQPLRNGSAEEAAAAIGGFVVLNDFSARDVQIDEMRSGFGPQKAKHFSSAISAELVTADEILPKLDQLTGAVQINGCEVATVSSSGGQFTLPEAIAFASQSENLFPGEMFGSGTLPGGAGIENDVLIAEGDRLTLTLSGIGSLTNKIGKKES